jgi:hypothetical protein
MHAYATDSGERKYIPGLLGVLSIVAALLLSEGLSLLSITVPWWFDAPSVMGFYGIFYSLFEKRIWKARLLHRAGLVSLPDLNGTWKGYLTSSHDLHKTQHPVIVEVSQRWRHISIRLESGSSVSRSESAALRTEDAGRITLSYEYFNEPKAPAVESMHAHRGTGRLTVDRANNREVLEGEYYTGRDRRMYGTLHLERS